MLTGLALFLALSPAVRSIDPFVEPGGFFEVSTPETARVILASLLTTLISITVFGFSMMIVVVNQAASNYSPKVVQTLSGQRSNQYILGVNLGTIIFTLIMMMHLDNKDANGGVPQLAIFANMALAIYSLLLFVKFINNISNAVRINNIIEMIYGKTKRSSNSWKADEHQQTNIDTTGWTVYNAGHAGYFQLIRVKPLLRALRNADAILRVIPLPGSYYLQHEPLFAVSRSLTDETANEIRSYFVTYHGEDIGENPMYGFRQLREIAVKALSPGINDPGVAILCIEHLSELLALQVQRTSSHCISDADGQPRILKNDFDFESLFELSVVPIKTYGKRDQGILRALLSAAYQISLYDEKKTARAILQRFALSVVEDADENINSGLERELLNRRISRLNDTRYFELALLTNAKQTGQNRA